MISQELKDKITPQLLYRLHPDERDRIDEMFEEVYLVMVDDRPRVVLKPLPEFGRITIEFSPLNGGYIQIADWEETKSIGKLL